LIAAAVALVVIVLIAFQPLVTWELRRRFARITGYEVTFGTSRLRPLEGTLELTRLEAVKPQAGGEKSPFFSTETMEISLRWHELFHGNIVANVDVDRAKVHLIAAKAKEQRQLEEISDLARKLEGVLPMRVDRVQATRSELTFIDRTTPTRPRLWLHGLEGTAENIATRAALSRGQPTTIAVASRLQQSAELSAYLTAHPLAKGLWFAGEAKVLNLDLGELHDLIASRTGVALDQGRLDVFSEFDCKQNHITGGVKPTLRNPRGVQATTIHIDEHILNPEAQLWPTVFGVLRNTFTEAVTESYERLPPPQAPKQESPFEPAADALDRNEAAPKAQPPGKQP
jgi:hypothetical protein